MTVDLTLCWEKDNSGLLKELHLAPGQASAQLGKDRYIVPGLEGDPGKELLSALGQERGVVASL